MPTIFRTKDRHGKWHHNWRFKFIDYTGQRKTATGLPTKEATKTLAWKIQAEQDEIRKGLRPAPKESEKPRLFDQILAEYLAWGASQGGHGGRPWSLRHYGPRKARLEFWRTRLKLELLADLNGSLPRVEEALRELQNKGRAGKTLQNYAEAICAFCDWALKRGYLDHDPLKNLQHFDTTPLTQRRAPTPEEIQAILAVAPPERRLLYQLALASGLRANELRSLRARHIDVVNSGLKLEANWTKGRKATFQPIHAELMAVLQQIGETKGQDEPLLKISKNAAASLYIDMAKAGVPKTTVEGKLDFHALRTGYTTLVFEAGASIKEAQSLARHSTPDLTLNVYARTRSARLAEVAQAVGDKILFKPAPSTTDVQRLDGAIMAQDITASDTTTSNAKIDPALEGSNPPCVINGDLENAGQPKSNCGQNMAQVGQQPGITNMRLVEKRTEADATRTDSGRAECTTVVQRPSGDRDVDDSDERLAA
ncbi:MAG TPA: tyrosine-type recombinase/integrase [Planctomycetota bacterium]|jgi:integrase